MAVVQNAYRDHLVWRFRNNTTVTRVYLTACVVLSLFVLAIVGAGIYFSYLQLVHAISADVTDEPATTVSVTPEGAQITSSVAGVVVLFLSLFFFYLYLKHVFAAMRFVPSHLSLHGTDYVDSPPEADDSDSS